MTGLRSFAPAASALLKNASTSPTYRWILTGEPPNVSLAAVFREFIRQHDHGITETDFRMTEAAVGHNYLGGLRRSERLLIELRRLDGILYG